jgi:putative tryptophan/tyrosine transport system substrate-binding protein
MRRRDFIGLFGGAAAMAACRDIARAQAGERPRRIAVLMSTAEHDPEGYARAAALRAGLRELGRIEGPNLRIDWRWVGGDVGRGSVYAAELVALAPDVIIVSGSSNVAAVKQATRSIPVVFAIVNDPVGQGFISSLARPGGNITGFTFVEYSMFAKSLDMLKQAAPDSTRVAFMFNPEITGYYQSFLPSFDADARRYSTVVIEAPVRSGTDIDAAIEKLAASPGGALIVPPDGYTMAHRDRIMAAAKAHGVPAIYSYRQFVKEGGLMSYGPDSSEVFRRAAAYVDNVLKGASPGELPAQAPSKFELAVNLKTAAALGLEMPHTLLALADEVVE